MVEEFETSTRWLQCFPRHHSISFEVFAAETWSTKHRADKVHIGLAEVDHKFRGEPVRCGVEASPARRKAQRSFYVNKGNLERLNKHTTSNEYQRIGVVGQDVFGEAVILQQTHRKTEVDAEAKEQDYTGKEDGQGQEINPDEVTENSNKDHDKNHSIDQQSSIRQCAATPRAQPSHPPPCASK